VDSPEPDGLRVAELAELLRPLVSSPRAIGLELTIYDPSLDPDGKSVSSLIALLEGALDTRGAEWFENRLATPRLTAPVRSRAPAGGLAAAAPDTLPSARGRSDST
jgi:hypothetical protein